MATYEYQRPWLYPAQERAIFCPERYAVIEAVQQRIAPRLGRCLTRHAHLPGQSAARQEP